MTDLASFSIEPMMSIGTVAAKLSISVSSIRKYETEGLIIPHRLPSGHRLFSPEDVERLKTIQVLIQETGLNIEGIRRLQAFIPCWDILPCSKEDRSRCPAYSDTTKPCWMISNIDCAESKSEKCRRCGVYRYATLKTGQIKNIVFEKPPGKNLAAAIKLQIEQWNNGSTSKGAKE